jgi:5-methylcytosine-specific restriction endonuclease McrA
MKRKPFKRKPPKVRTAKPPLLRKWAKTPPKVSARKPLVMRERKPSRLKIRIDPLDTLFSLYIRTRDNFTCQRCGVKSKNVQCAHFIGRRNKTTRWLETNATTLCMGCHGYFHANPLIFVEWTKKRLGEKEFDFLLAQERIITKPDKRAIEIYLKTKLAKYLLDK